MGAPRPTRSRAVEAILDDHADALFNFALAVTSGADEAMEAVREGIGAAIEEHGPEPSLACLLGSVLDAALRRTSPAGGPGEPFERPLHTEREAPADLDELRRICRRAVMTLEPRDRAILELTLRQGLEGEELSEALGVPPGLAATSTKSALEHAEQVVGAVLLSRVAHDDCPGLAAALRSLAPASDLDRLAAVVLAHQQECASCADRRRALVSVTSLLAAVPPTPAPPELRRLSLLRRRPAPDRSARPRPGAGKRARGSSPVRRPTALWLTGAALVVVALGVVAGALFRRDGAPPAAGRAAGGGELVLSVSELDFGGEASEAAFEIGNAGTQPLEFRTRPADTWLRLGPAAGTVRPGERVRVVAVMDRSQAPEGEISTEIGIHSSGGSRFIPISADVDRPPALSGLMATPSLVASAGCPGETPAQVRVNVVEESGARQVVLHWRGPDRSEGSSTMTGDGQSFVAALGPFTEAGEVEWWVSATDGRGNGAASAPNVLRVEGC